MAGALSARDRGGGRNTGQTSDSDMLVMALAYVGAIAAALGFFCFLSRLLKLAGSGSRRALFRILADLEDF